MPSRDISCSVGRLSSGEYWVQDDFADVQVGWINRDEDGKWFILDDVLKERAGPFRTLRDATKCVEDVLADEFNIGSPAN